MYLEITNDIHLGLKFGCCNAENRKKGGFPQKYSPDGVHPNLEGYKIMEQIVSSELVKIKLRKKVIY